jgi:hypothetical protein
MDIAQRVNGDFAVIEGFLIDPHPAMPVMSLTRQEIRDLIAYFATLRCGGSSRSPIMVIAVLGLDPRIDPAIHSVAFQVGWCGGMDARLKAGHDEYDGGQ